MLGRQKKKTVHMPYNLQTATTEPFPVFLYPLTLGIQTQVFSEIISSGRLEMLPSRASKAGHLYSQAVSRATPFKGLSVFPL